MSRRRAASWKVTERQGISMKVERNITVFAGDPGRVCGAEKPEEAQNEKEEKNGSVIYAGDFRGDMTVRDRIQQKKEQAQKQAMKVVQDAWNIDRAIDDDLDERRERIGELNQSGRESRDRIAELQGQQEKLRENGVAEDSEDYRNLEERIRTEQDVVNKNEQQVRMEAAVIRGTKLERLKYHHMANAQKDAEEIKKAAGDEIMGMLMEDAKEHIDEKQEEREKKAEEIKEKKEEQEELIEKRREDKKEREELIEDMPVDEILDLAKTQNEIQQEVQDIMNKMALVAEDIKGAVVDTSV